MNMVAYFLHSTGQLWSLLEKGHNIYPEHSLTKNFISLHLISLLNIMMYCITHLKLSSFKDDIVISEVKK